MGFESGPSPLDVRQDIITQQELDAKSKDIQDHPFKYNIPRGGSYRVE